MRQAWLVMSALLLFLSGCGTDNYRPLPDEPIPEAPLPKEVHYKKGAIFQSEERNYEYHPLFENIRARTVGDTLTVLITEKLISEQKTNNKLTRSSNVAGGLGDTMRKLPSFGLKGLSISANTNNSFDGEGQSNAALTFSGTITVIIQRVLHNGNFVIIGQKHIATNNGTQYLQLTGIVNPHDISPENNIHSSQIANAKLTYLERGDSADFNTPGWMHRIINKISPF